MKKLYVEITMTDEQWAEWSNGYEDPIDPLCDVASAIDSAVGGLDVENTIVWGSLSDFLTDNVLESLGGVK